MDLPHEWRHDRTQSGRVVISWCQWCRARHDAPDELLHLLWMIPREELFSAEVNDAVDAFMSDADHPLIDRLRAEIEQL